MELRELGGFERPLGDPYQLKLDPAEFGKATAGLKFGTSEFGKKMEPLARSRFAAATGQSFVDKAAEARGADILPVQLRLRYPGVP